MALELCGRVILELFLAGIVLCGAVAVIGLALLPVGRWWSRRQFEKTFDLSKRLN